MTGQKSASNAQQPTEAATAAPATILAKLNASLNINQRTNMNAAIAAAPRDERVICLFATPKPIAGVVNGQS